ncbi:unnamed protein product, partial [Ectocarpus sp. 13 AM-2016]
QETPQEEGGEVRLPGEDDGSESRCPLAERWSQRHDPGRSILTGCSRVRLFYSYKFAPAHKPCAPCVCRRLFFESVSFSLGEHFGVWCVCVSLLLGPGTRLW